LHRETAAGQNTGGGNPAKGRSREIVVYPGESAEATERHGTHALKKTTGEAEDWRVGWMIQGFA